MSSPCGSFFALQFDRSGPASIIYNERGHRAEEDEPDSGPDDDILLELEPSSCSSTAVSRAQSRPRSTASSNRNSAWGLPKAESTPLSNAESPPSKASSSPEPPHTSYKDLQDRGSQRGRSRKEGESSVNTRSSSILAETLASVWGAVASSSSGRKSALHSQSKDVTPLASPKQGSRQLEASEATALGTTTPTPEKRETQTVDTSVELSAETAKTEVSLPAAPEQSPNANDSEIAAQSERTSTETLAHTAANDLSLAPLSNGTSSQKASTAVSEAKLEGGTESTEPKDTVQAELLQPSAINEPETSEISSASVSEAIVQPEGPQGAPLLEGSQSTSDSAIINEQAARNDDLSGSSLTTQAGTDETPQLYTVGEKTLQNPQPAPTSPILSQKPGLRGSESGDGDNQSKVASTDATPVSESTKSIPGEAASDLGQNRSLEVNLLTGTDKDGTGADNEDSNVGGEAEEDAEEKEPKQGKKASKKKKKKAGRRQSTASIQATTGDVADAAGRQPSASDASEQSQPDPVTDVLPGDGKMELVSSLSLKLGDANWPRTDASLHVITQEA